MCLVCLPDLLLLGCWVLLGFEQIDFFCLFVLTEDVFGNENTQVYWCTSVKTSMVFAPLPCLSRRTCKSITACCILPSPTIFPSKQKVCGETAKKGRLCNKMSRAATFSFSFMYSQCGLGKQTGMMVMGVRRLAGRKGPQNFLVCLEK